MFHRFFRCIILLTLLIVVTFNLRAQNAPLLDCPDTQPYITGADVVCDQNAALTYTYSTPPTTGTPTHSYQWTISPATGRTIVGSTTQNQLQVKWQSPGTYTVQVTEWNNDPNFAGCVGITSTKTVTVQPLLHAYFYYQFDPSGGCFYNVVNFTGDVSVHADPNITYTWDFGDGTPVTPGPGVLTHTFPAVSNVTYTVKLTVTNSAGFSDQIIDYVYVNPDQYKPVANFTHSATPLPDNCLYNPMSFDASSSLAKPITNPENITILYYEWDFDDPGSGSQNLVNSGTSPIVNHTFSTPGIHNVKLTVTNSKYCTHTITKTVDINNTIPTASFTNTLACLGEATQFTSTSVTPMGTITQLDWIFGDGVSYTSTNPSEIVTHTYSQLGSYVAKLRVTTSNNCISEYFSKSVSVNPSPMASFLVGNACLGDAVQFTNTSTLNGGSQISGYLWNFDDPISGSNTSTDPNPTHLFSAVGNYDVSLQVTNTDGCANTYILSPALVVSPKPSVDFTFQNGFVNWEVLFFQITQPSVGNNLLWDFGDGFFGYGPNPSHIYQGPGNFLVTLTATDAINGCSNSIQHQVTIMSNGSAFFTADTPKCIGDTMHFTPQIPGGNIVKEVWDYGDGTIITYNPPVVFPVFATHIYNQSGTFTVTRTVTYITNFYESFSIQVVVHPQPNANFTYSNNPAFPNSYGCAHQAVYFTDLSFPPAGNIIDWFWNFGDPGSGVDNTSTLQNPQHTFTNANQKYAVSLTVTDNINYCKSTIVDTVYIHPEVPVDFTFTNNTCLNQVVSFSANMAVMMPDSIATWDWDFGDGTIHATSPLNAAHLYTTAGTYTAILTVTDIHGCSNSVSKTVTVMPRPVAGYTFVSPTCDHQAVQFTDQSFVPAGFPGFINKWVWHWGDGTTTQIDLPNSPNVSHIFPAGIYNFQVKLVVTSSFGCVDSITRQVTLIPAPLAAFEVQPGTPSCATQLVQFIDLSQPNGGGSLVGWLWNFGDPTSGSNNFSTSPNPTHLFANPAIYPVILKVTNSNGCTHADTMMVTIDSLPDANFTFDTACAGGITQFTDLSYTPSGSIITSYSWNFGDGNTSPLQSPTHNYATYGVYNVTLTIVNSKGCIKSITKQVKVSPLPIPAFTFSPAGCLGNPVSFTDLSFIPSGFSGYIYKWTWDFGDGSAPVTRIHPQSPNVSHAFPGPAVSYTVRLTVQTSDSCTAYIEKDVNNIPSPLANFTYSSTTCIGQTVQFSDLTQTNGGGSIQTWNWNFGDPSSGTNNISTQQHPTHAFTGTGKFYITLTVTSTNGCVHTKLDSLTINALPVANFTYTSACEGGFTSFNSSSTNPNASQITSYSWTFGDGGNSTLSDPDHIFATSGTFQVSLTVVNSNGCIHTITKPVIVNPKPVAAFTFSAGACIGSPVAFTDQSFVPVGLPGQIKTWYWEFGDGTNSGLIVFPSSPHQVHTYNGPGTVFVVRLTVMTFDSCTSFIEKTVTTVPKPIANFTHDPNVCANQPIQFTDLSQQNGGGSIQSWLWNFGDPPSGANNTATVANPVHQFTSSTVPPTPPYNVVLKVTNGNGCYDYDTIQVSVTPKPVANFVADTACLGSQTQFNANSSSAVSGTITSYLWNFGDGTTSTGNPTTHQYATAGLYNVTLTISNSGFCVKDTIKPVLVLAKPVASFSYSSPNCAGDSIQFTDLSSTTHGSIKTWKWDFGDGSPVVTIQFPDNQNIKHKFNNGGNYNVTLTITTTDDCEAVKVNTVQVGFRPLANFSFNANSCALIPVQFTDLTQTNGGPALTSWSWNFGNPESGVNNTSTTQNPLHSFTSGGTYIVRLVVTNANGCIDSVAGGKSITINATPLAQFSFDTSCMASPTQFTDESTPPTGATIATWNWNFGDPASGSSNFSTQQNPTHTYNVQGTYTVLLTVTTNQQCSKDTTMTITVSPKPQANFSYAASCVGDSTQFTDLSIAPGSSIQSHFWDFGDGGTSTLPNPWHTFTTTGTFQVKLTVTNLANCVDSVTIPVITRPKPVADFNYTSHFCPPGEVNFQDISTTTGATITDRTWIFPTITVGGNNPSPTYVFPTTNVWDTVTLIVQDNFGCKDTIVDTVFVKPGFDFTFTNDTNICFGYPMRFYPQNNTPGDSLYSVSWNFGDPDSGPANTSTLFKPTHVFTRTGLFVVKMKAYNSDNCVDSVYREVRVWALPEPAFSFVNPACNDTVFFTDTTQVVGNGPIVRWTWNFGDGNSTTINYPGPGHTSHYYANPGIYPVTLIQETVHGCVDSVTTSVQRFPCIMAGFSYADTLCARYEIAFADTSLPVARINQWTWNWGDGTPNTVLTTYTTPVYHTFANAGTYNVSLEVQALVNNTTITDVFSKSVVIHPTPETHFANPYVCLNQLTLFRDTSTTYGEPITKWLWNFSANPVDTSTLQNPPFRYDTAGIYNVRLISANRFGCKDTLEKSTRVYGLPIAHYDNNPACVGDPTEFFDRSAASDTALAFWYWSFGDPSSNHDTSFIQNPKYRYRATGDYSIRMIVEDLYGCLDTIDSTVRVNVTPLAAFTLIDNYNGKQGQVKLNNLSAGADDYLWEFGNNKTSTEVNPITSFTDDGTYSIKLISTNQFDCADTTIYEYKLLFKGLYVPNAFAPTSTNLGVRLFQPAGHNLKRYHIQVFDVWGHMVWESTKLDDTGAPSEGWDGTFEGNLLPQGNYMWKIEATFIDDSPWNGSDVGVSASDKTMGTVTLIR
jgi:PKD repeat protein